MIGDATKPIPELPTYLTPQHFATKKQTGPLTKMISKMLKPKMHRMMKSPMKSFKNKHKVKFY